MSSALIRQALEFVDPEGHARSAGKKRRAPPSSGQERRPRKNKAPRKFAPPRSEADRTEENVKKLLALSKPVADQALTDKLVSRAAAGKPLSDFVPVPSASQPERSILFPEETFKDFESQLFTTGRCRMDPSDRIRGQFGLGITLTAFALAACWVNFYPFIDEESALFLALPDPRILLLASATWGLLFIGGLMAFTLYHLYPHL